MLIETKFDMGDEVKDTVTNYQGVIVAITYYMTGCIHCSLQSKMTKDGKVADWENFDETRLKIVKKARVAKVKPSGKSGPAPKVEQQ